MFCQSRDCVAEPVRDFGQAGKDFVSKTTLTDLFPNLLDGIDLRYVWRDMEQFYVLRDLQCARFVPCCTIAAQHNDVIRVFLG